MTYIGSGVEYGERITTWLGKDSTGPLGILKDVVEIRWTEPSWVCPYEDQQSNPDCYDWTDYSKWDLLEVRKSANESDNFLARILNSRKIEINEFENIDEFGGAPFETKRTAGMHPVKLKFNN